MNSEKKKANHVSNEKKMRLEDRLVLEEKIDKIVYDYYCQPTRVEYRDFLDLHLEHLLLLFEEKIFM